LDEYLGFAAMPGWQGLDFYEVAMRMRNGSLLRQLLAIFSWSATFFQPAWSQEANVVSPSQLADCVLIQEGELPIILSAPHGGTLGLDGVPERQGEGLKTGGSGFVISRDTATTELAQAVSLAIEQRLGKRPFLVASKIHRKYLDPNRPPEIAYEDTDAKPVYDFYHQQLHGYCRQVTEKFRSGLLLDIHGQGSQRDTVFRGTRNGATVQHLRATFGESAHTGPQSLFGLLSVRGWKVHPQPMDGTEQAGYNGGHIVGTYGRLPGTVIDAIQLEFGAEYRVKSRQAATAAVLADAVADYASAYLKIQVPPTSQRNEPQKTRVAVFVDDGVSATDKLMAVLQTADRLSVTRLSAEDIRRNALAEVDVLIHPGGSGGGQGKALGEEGRECVRRFVADGNGFLGICAGAYLASCDYSWSLNLLDAKVLDRQHWARGFGSVEIALTAPALELFQETDATPDIYYHQGPLLAPAQVADVPDYEPLASYVGEIAKNGAPHGVMPGTTAIARGTYHRGRVLCFSPHPEKTDGLGRYVLEAIDWLDGNR
jgi:N-formylglutamate amidohydrolase